MSSTARTCPETRLITVVNALESIDQLHPDDWPVIEDFLARKRENDQIAAAGASARVAPMEDVQAGCTGSQPIESPRALDHVGEVEKTWVYEDDFHQQMLDQQWIEILNAIDGNLQRLSTKFTLTRKLLEGSSFAKEYVVDIDAMTSTNKKSKKARALHRMELRVVRVKHMRVADFAATVSALIDKGWTMHWQSEDLCGWKNVSEEWNQSLLNAFTDPNMGDDLDVCISLYDILRAGHRHQVVRPLPVRIVALKELCNS